MEHIKHPCRQVYDPNQTSLTATHLVFGTQITFTKDDGYLFPMHKNFDKVIDYLVEEKGFKLVEHTGKAKPVTEKIQEAFTKKDKKKKVEEVVEESSKEEELKSDE